MLLHEELFEYMSELSQWNDVDEILIIPVPVSQRRLRERGYDQCEFLLEVMKKGNLLPPYYRIVRREINREERPHQTSLPRKERLINVSGSFSVANPLLLQNKHIVILDDVTTTGATLEEAKRILQECSPKTLHLIALAH
jgi:ComF family protein